MPATAFDLERAARHLIDGHVNKTPFSPFAESFGIDDLEKAYAVQAAFVAGMHRGKERAGYKIGLTSQKMQSMVGISQPIAGTMYSDRLIDSPATLSVADFGRLGLEFEIAVRLSREINADNLPDDRDALDAFIDAVGPAFEVIEDRAADYSGLDIFSIVADNSWGWGAVIGEMKRFDGDLAAVRGVLTVNGEDVGEGAGADVLGHPFESLLWLARHLTSRGRRLKKGEVVLTGSLLQSRFPGPGDSYEFSVEGLGAVKVGVTA